MNSTLAAEVLARYTVVLMERGLIRPSAGLSSEAITIMLDRAGLVSTDRSVVDAWVARPSDREIRAAFKQATPPAVR